MNKIAEEILSYYGSAEENDISDDVIEHYGIKRRSGRYPYGSGENPYQHSEDFIARVNDLRNKNFTFKDKDGKTWKGDTAIAKAMGLTSSQFRIQMSMANAEQRSRLVNRAVALREKGYSLDRIAKEMGYENDSSVRSLLNEASKARMNAAQATKEIVAKELEGKRLIDVGEGSEKYLNVSKEKLNEALYMLEMDGYHIYKGRVPQATNPGKYTTVKVIASPEAEYKEIYNFDNIKQFGEFQTNDEGLTFKKFRYPASIDSSRIDVDYESPKDGLVEIRRGVEDLSLGKSAYSQVRILVDGTHYIKGMAVYSDDLPDGVDIRVCSHKSKGTPLMSDDNEHSVLKNIKNDPDNPFGSLIMPEGQSEYIGADGEKHLSAINKRADEGDWGKWADSLSGQFLSKQPMKLIERQLKMSLDDKQAEFDDIMALDNPVVQRKLLKEFSDDCDKGAETLKAAALPRQKYQVLLPATTLKDDEIYAPNYEDGEKVALVRYPHGGTFEIPILTVNNNNKECQKMIGNTPKDAVCIGNKAAARLSGADFDGDTAMVIPTGKNGINIKSSKPLFEDFDTTMAYPQTATSKVMSKKNTGREMGQITNLITDMTIQGASREELARAVKHSMVVIDAAKHKLDYKRSEEENGIAALKARYQGHYDEDGKYSTGAGTLISRASASKRIPKTKGQAKYNDDGSIYYDKADEYYVDKKGKKQLRLQETTQMRDTKDARTLSTGSPIEEAYASYANSLKSMANKARKNMLATPRLEQNPEAKVKYAKEVKHLEDQLKEVEMNKPKERAAQYYTASVIKSKMQADPELKEDKSVLKKLKQQTINEARNKFNAEHVVIEVTPRDWEAIQSGAISDNKLSKILDHTDSAQIRQYATPRSQSAMTPAMERRINTMAASGYTQAQIASAIGKSVSTVNNYLSSKDKNE